MDTLERLRDAAKECIDNGATVTIDSMEIGHLQAQGDVGVWRIARLPAGAEPSAPNSEGDWQMAPGTTRGSRHVIAAGSRAHVTLHRVNDNDELSDLCVVATAPWELTHPEHGNCIFPPGIFRLIHQQNERRERVMD